jgi:hypothetical protein
MGKFAESAAKHSINRRGDGYCVAGRWIAENLDEDDLTELQRLAENRKWGLICRLSDNALKVQSLKNHVYGGCTCHDGNPGKGCCTDQDMES